MKNVFFEKTRIKNEIKVFSDIIIAKSESYFKEQIFLWNKMVKMKSEEFFWFYGKMHKMNKYSLDKNFYSKRLSENLRNVEWWCL